MCLHDYTVEEVMSNHCAFLSLLFTIVGKIQFAEFRDDKPAYSTHDIVVLQ